MSDLKKMIEKSQAYDNIMNAMDDMVAHTKGFAFDSLVFRFKDYQARAFQSEVIDYKYKHHSSEIEARQRVKDMHNRDLIRFIEILDEVIGKHD